MTTETLIALAGSPFIAGFFAWFGSRREKRASAKRSELKTAMDEISVYNKIIDDLRKERTFHYDELQDLKKKLDEFTIRNQELLDNVAELKKDYFNLQKSYSSLQKSYKSLESKYQEMLNQNSNNHE